MEVNVNSRSNVSQRPDGNFPSVPPNLGKGINKTPIEAPKSPIPSNASPGVEKFPGKFVDLESKAPDSADPLMRRLGSLTSRKANEAGVFQGTKQVDVLIGGKSVELEGRFIAQSRSGTVYVNFKSPDGEKQVTAATASLTGGTPALLDFKGMTEREALDALEKIVGSAESKIATPESVLESESLVTEKDLREKIALTGFGKVFLSGDPQYALRLRGPNEGKAVLQLRGSLWRATIGNDVLKEPSVDKSRLDLTLKGRPDLCKDIVVAGKQYMQAVDMARKEDDLNGHDALPMLYKRASSIFRTCHPRYAWSTCRSDRASRQSQRLSIIATRRKYVEEFVRYRSRYRCDWA